MEHSGDLYSDLRRANFLLPCLDGISSLSLHFRFAVGAGNALHHLNVWAAKNQETLLEEYSPPNLAFEAFPPSRLGALYNACFINKQAFFSRESQENIACT